MPRARKTLVSLDTTPYYHCTSRCVGRAFLCGEDQQSGRNYEHRRQWIEDRLLMLASIHAIDIAAYAIMSNHYHVVLYVDQQRGLDWSDADVIERWHRLFRGSELSRRFCRGETLDRAEQRALAEQATAWRERLVSISWFMRCLNEPIARNANREDNVTGRFWEGRYSSQALLDEKALAACMVYVDLNPIRARLATTPETSKHTSVQRRIKKRGRRNYPIVSISNPNNCCHLQAIHATICPPASRFASPNTLSWSTGVVVFCVKTRTARFRSKYGQSCSACNWMHATGATSPRILNTPLST